MAFPNTRLRRLRHHKILRDSLQSTLVTARDLIQPYFVCEGEKIKNKVKTMPGIYQFSVDELLKEVKKNLSLGLNKIILFGVTPPEEKDAKASYAKDSQAPVQQALQALKEEFGQELFVITDVCACEYTDHGHCGIVTESEAVSDVENDETLELLTEIAVSHAEAGADMVAPSDMMDGRVRAIRQALDEAGFHHLPIMSYAVKYASSLYGPFREAAGSDNFEGTRKTYQMDYRREVTEALHESKLDVEEGADLVMVKPAGFYLDVIAQVKSQALVPVAAYQVSGEYSMLLAASQVGAGNLQDLVLESLTAIKRAGASLIISYFSQMVLEKNWLKK